MKKESGDWTRYRKQFALEPTDETDLHFGRRGLDKSYDEVMAEVESIVEGQLLRAQKNGRPYHMFIHGWSTSRPGQTTARSVVRQFIRSAAATLLIERSDCIQHDSVFVAKVRLEKKPA